MDKTLWEVMTIFLSIFHVSYSLQLEFLGEKSFQTGLQIDRTEFGGISAITYNPPQNVFYALSDDRSQFAPARFYSLDITPGAEGFEEIAIRPEATILDASALTEGNQPFEFNSIDPEGIVYDRRNGEIYWSSERDENNFPSIHRMQLSGEKLLPDFEIPSYYKHREGRSQGVRENLGFESLTLTADGTHIVTGTENALRQDGPASSQFEFSPSRILVLSLSSSRPIAEYVYSVNPSNYYRGKNGLVELVTLNSTHYLSTERSYSPLYGNEINFYTFSFEGATNVLGREELYLNSTVLLFKTPVLKISEGTFDLDLDNIEAATLGPELDGNRTLILVSDNNFNERQKTQFLLFRLLDE